MVTMRCTTYLFIQGRKSHIAAIDKVVFLFLARRSRKREAGEFSSHAISQDDRRQQDETNKRHRVAYLWRSRTLTLALNSFFPSHFAPFTLLRSVHVCQQHIVVVRQYYLQTPHFAARRPHQESFELARGTRRLEHFLHNTHGGIGLRCDRTVDTRCLTWISDDTSATEAICCTSTTPGA